MTQRRNTMTLITKFKSGKVVTYENVDDVDLDKYDDYLYVYMVNGSLLRCRAHAVRFFIQRYSTGDEYVVFPDNEY